MSSPQTDRNHSIRTGGSASPLSQWMLEIAYGALQVAGFEPSLARSC